MFLNASVHKTLTAAKAAALLSACGALIVFSDGSRAGAAKGIELCLGVLTPSLFPFMALTNLFVNSGSCEKAGRALNGITQKLFGVSGALAPVILLSMIGGYPVGAGGIARLKERGAISEADAERAALFAVCAGPGFVISFVGAALCGSAEIGMVMFAAQVISVPILGVLSRFLVKGNAQYNSNIELSSTALPFDCALTASVYSAAKGMLVICAYVTAFSSVTGMLGQIFSRSQVTDALLVLLEVCSAVNSLSKGYPLTFTAFAVGFGGLCAHFQIFSELGEVKVNKLLFFGFRIMQGLLTALLTYAGLRLLPISTAAFSTARTGGAALYGGSIASGAALLCILICFFISVKPNRG